MRQHDLYNMTKHGLEQPRNLCIADVGEWVEGLLGWSGDGLGRTLIVVYNVVVVVGIHLRCPSDRDRQTVAIPT